MAAQSTSQLQLASLVTYQRAVLAVLAKIPYADPDLDSIRESVDHLQGIYESNPSVAALLAGAAQVQESIELLDAADDDHRDFALAGLVRAVTNFGARKGELCLPRIH